MDIETGLRRIGMVSYVLGVIWGIVFTIGAITELSASNKSDALTSLGIGVVGYAFAWCISWIVMGFAGKEKP